MNKDLYNVCCEKFSAWKISVLNYSYKTNLTIFKKSNYLCCRNLSELNVIICNNIKQMVVLTAVFNYTV